MKRSSGATSCVSCTAKVKTALIFGVSGQDGAYLSRLLLAKNYRVHGASRDASQSFTRLATLGIRERVETHTVSMTDPASMRELSASIRPDEIYNLAGLSSVALSFIEPATAWSSVAHAHEVLLETVRRHVPRARVYHSTSSDCYGDRPQGSSCDESTPFAPCSPYGEAKAAAHRLTAETRARHGLHACSGIVFNHESPLRGDAFVTRKIVAKASDLAAGRSTEPLRLGDVTASRDWGYAPETVEAIWLMLQQDVPEDLVIATGENHTVGELAAAAFEELGLDHHDHVEIEPSLMRRSEIRYSRGDASRAKERLGWEARTKFRALVRLLIEAARA